MDDDCDEIIKELYQSDSKDMFRDLLAHMEKNSAEIPEALPFKIKSFLRKNHPPVLTEYDFLMFRQANRIWKREGIKFIFILFFRALPFTYMAEKPANVLRLTKLLKEHPDRRILETAQFVFDVMEEEWWKREKGGILTALKVRMLHSAIRYNLLNHPEGETWNKAWGMPISQEDLIATNQVFSLEFIKGMEILGSPLNEDEQKAWFHTWKMIGKIMGIQDELLCDNVQEAWMLQKSIYNHLFCTKRHTSGIGLGKSLVSAMSEFLNEGIVLHMMRDMMNDEDHPDLFYRMFHRDYEGKYSSLFKSVSEDLTKLHEEEIQKDHLSALEDLHEKLQNEAAQKSTPSNRKKIIEFHLPKFRNILANHKKSNKSFGLKMPHLKKDIMVASSELIINLLAIHFRPSKSNGHKPTTFRIPIDLSDNLTMPH